MRSKLQILLESHNFHTCVMVLIIFEIMLYFVEHILFLKECTEGEHHQDLEIWEKVLHFISISVLGLFVLEIALKIYAFGLDYLSKALNVFEFLLVFGGFLAEILLPNIGGDIATFLIALRMIRLIRFAHAFQETFEKEKNYEIFLLTKEIKQLNSQIQEFTNTGHGFSGSMDTLSIVEPEPLL